MNIIRRRSRTSVIFAAIINTTAVLGYVTIIAAYLWFKWYTEGGPQ